MQILRAQAWQAQATFCGTLSKIIPARDPKQRQKKTMKGRDTTDQS